MVQLHNHHNQPPHTQYSVMNISRRLYHLPVLLLVSIYYKSAHSHLHAFAIRRHRREERRLGILLTDLDNASSAHKKCGNKVNDCLHRCSVSVMTVIASAVLLFPTSSVAYESIVQQPNPAAWQSSSVVMGGSAADLSSLTAESITDLGLKPPTEDKPQITLGDRSSVSNESVKRKPIIQGLVFFPEIAPSDPTAKVPPGQQEKQALDYYSDVLVLTAASATQPDLVLAGAKFPVSAVRFPFSFEMYNENLLTSRSGVQNAWDSVEKTGDIIVKAIICPSDASTLPCDINETKKSAQGVAKLITNLPGLKEGETIRAPASLGLQ